MRGFEIIAIVIGVFFAIGIAVGMLLVIALPLLRAALGNRRCHRRYREGGANWRRQPPRDDDDWRSSSLARRLSRRPSIPTGLPGCLTGAQSS